MNKGKSKWMKVSDVAEHFGVSADTIVRRGGMFSLLKIAQPTERTTLVLRSSVESLDAELEKMAKQSAA